MAELSYPIGRFQPPEEITPTDVSTAVDHIATLPAELRAAVAGLTEAQLETPYRPEGWTVRQVVHHLADSHMNSYIRFRLALTEERPTVKPYDEKSWAELPDARAADVNVSLSLLDTMHERWVILLRAMKPEDWKRTFLHPEHGVRLLDWNALLYAWHGRHHVAHITSLRQRNGWSE